MSGEIGGDDEVTAALYGFAGGARSAAPRSGTDRGAASELIVESDGTPETINDGRGAHR
jgi:hypothetical protein